MTEWRFIATTNADGATNMAIDEAILLEHIAGNCPPTLRLYRFVPPAVTIGLSQKMNPDVISSIQSQGIDVVRRPTGGRAVLHMDDLTYCFVGGDTTLENGFLSTSVNESYKQICAGLVQALRLIGVEAELGDSGVAYRHLQDCFMATSGSDLQHQGTKVVGSAQTRRRGAILQHGSLPLKQDPSLMSKILQEPEQAKARHCNLFDICNREISDADLEQAFKSGFEQAFKITMKEAHLTAAENAKVNELRAQYAACAAV